VLRPTADHLLFGDVGLEEPLGVGGLELLGVGRIADFPVYDHDLGTRSQCDQRVPVGHPGGDFLAELVDGQLDLRVRVRSNGRVARGARRQAGA
jgi:hypothetical protein